MKMKGSKIALTGIFGVLPVFGIVFMGCAAGAEKNKPGQETIMSGRPLISAEPGGAVYALNDKAETMIVEAESPDGGEITYQWYKNSEANAGDSLAINGETAPVYTPPTDLVGTVYYSVVVTNTRAGKTNSARTALAPIRTLASVPEIPAVSAVITVNTGTRYQYIRGFGGMSNVWVSPKLTAKDIDTLFSPDALGYNIFRICIYPYMDALFDGTEPYEPAATAGYTNPPDTHKDYYEMVKRARSHGATILASPWTFPAEWKDTGLRGGGGHLLEEYYDDYAYYLRDYVKRMADNGAPIDIISVQNEPDIDVTYDGSDWPPEAMYNFIKNYIPLIREEIKPVKIMPGESFNFNHNMYESILNDPEAVKNIDIVGGHIYGGGLTRYDNAINKGKEVWMTEHLLNTSGNYDYDSTWPAVWPFAKDIHNSMEAAHFSAYLWWHAKRFYSMVGDGSYNTVEGEILPRGYVMSHYAKYATGKTRVAAAAAGASAASVYVTAYESDKDISLVIFNEGTADAGYVRIDLPFAVRSANGIKSSEAAGTMAPEIIRLSADKKSGTVAMPPATILSIKFTK
ncbi:MAG: hypothetical protein LBL28_07760 [Treponema sp.]|jgi:O-glycosyl hydrolase|nr:hypothetical protein [Treponema sp.]